MKYSLHSTRLPDYNTFPPEDFEESKCDHERAYVDDSWVNEEGQLITEHFCPTCKQRWTT